MAAGSTIVIEELGSDGTPQGRSFVLSGPSLPTQGASWAMKLAVTTTWYPGNGDEATQQVLGPQEAPTRWTGRWSSLLLRRAPATFIDADGAPAQVGAPMDLRDAVEAVARGGARLRVTWFLSVTELGPTYKTVREGRWTDLEWRHGYADDVEWSWTFEWVSRGNAAPPKVTSTRSDTVATDSAAYLAAIQALVDANTNASLAALNPLSLTLGQLEAFANAPTALANSFARSIQQITSEVGQVVDIAKTIASQPLQVVNRAVALAKNTVAQVNNFRDTLGQIPAEQQATKQNVADLLRATKAFSKQSDAAGTAARAGQVFSAQLSQQVQPLLNSGATAPGLLGSPNGVRQTYMTKHGDTPHSVSQMFYGTPDHAVDLLHANKLPWHTPTFAAGRPIVIPVLPSSSRTQGV